MAGARDVGGLVETRGSSGLLKAEGGTGGILGILGLRELGAWVGTWGRDWGGGGERGWMDGWRRGQGVVC